MEAKIKSFLETKDSEYQDLKRHVEVNDLQGLVNKNQNNSSDNNINLTEAVKTIIARLEKYLNEKSFPGRFHPTGSTFIKSDISKNQDFDFLFVHSGIKNFELTAEEEEFPDLYHGEGNVNPKTLHNTFREHIETAINDTETKKTETKETETKTLQGVLTFAGYGNPIYNGLRRNGPAVTCLIQHDSTGDKVITLDLTLGLPAPEEIQVDIIRRLEWSLVWGRHFKSLEDQDKVLHIVPSFTTEPTEVYRWLLSTAVLETKLLKKLKITETIRAIKVLGNALSLKSSRERYFRLIGFDDKAMEVHKRLSRHLLKTEAERVTLGHGLFYDHVFLPEYVEEDYLEKTKQIISISGAAVKFFVLCELRDGRCKEGDGISWPTVHRFFSSLTPAIDHALDNLARGLKTETLTEQDTPFSEPHVMHPFLSSKVRKINFARYAVVGKEIERIFGVIYRDRCKDLIPIIGNLAKKFQSAEREESQHHRQHGEDVAHEDTDEARGSLFLTASFKALQIK